MIAVEFLTFSLGIKCCCMSILLDGLMKEQTDCLQKGSWLMIYE